MNAHVDTIRDAFDAFAESDVQALRDLLHPEVVWVEPGRGPLAGTYRGRDAVLGHLGAVMDLTEGTGSATLLECGEIAPATVAALVRFAADAPRPMDEDGMQLFRFRDGRIAEVRSFAEDQYAQDEALAPSGETDVERTRRGYDAFARGDLDEIRDILSPDIAWHVPGRSRLAGTYVGTDAVLGYFIALFENSGGTFRAELLQCGEIEPGTVACTVRCTGTMAAGPLDTTIVQTFRIVDGRTTEAWSYSSDQYAMDEAIGTAAISLPDARRPETAPVIT